MRLRPFLDTRPFTAAADQRDRHRAALAERYGLNPDVPWLLAVGMMRGGDKERSYEILAKALSPSPAKRGRVGEGASDARNAHAQPCPRKSVSASSPGRMASVAS